MADKRLTVFIQKRKRTINKAELRKKKSWRKAEKEGGANLQHSHTP